MGLEGFKGKTDNRLTCTAKLIEDDGVSYGFRDNTTSPPRFACVSFDVRRDSYLEHWVRASGPLTQWQCDKMMGVEIASEKMGLHVALGVEGVAPGLVQFEGSRLTGGYPMDMDQLAVSLAQIVLAQPTVQ